MGILDDAIREHLDLKRKHGASSRELEQLEQDAFGPPSRPGDEDSDDGSVSEAPPQDEVLEEELAPGEREGEHEDEGEDGGALSATERARIDHPELDDTASHPAPVAEPEPEALEEPEDLPDREPPFEPGARADAEPAGPEAPEAEAPEAPEPEGEAEAPEAAIFDPEDDLAEFDLDLDLDDEPPAGHEPGAEEAAGRAEAPAADEDIDLDLPEDAAIEHPLPLGAEPEHQGLAEPAEDEPYDDAEDEGEPYDEYEDEEEGEVPSVEDQDEDLLEETPDFLKDAPEGDRLWFEQGSPQDFDFDE